MGGGKGDLGGGALDVEGDGACEPWRQLAEGLVWD